MHEVYMDKSRKTYSQRAEVMHSSRTGILCYDIVQVAQARDANEYSAKGWNQCMLVNSL